MSSDGGETGRATAKPAVPRWLVRTAQVVAGTLVGLVLTEVIFHAVDAGAFPHLNVYVPDPGLGVRLRPGATEKTRVEPNPVTNVRINSLGLRGAELALPAANSVVVVGDSTVFGLGVEEDEAFPARLAAELHRPVVNAG